MVEGLRGWDGQEMGDICFSLKNISSSDMPSGHMASK